MFKRKPIVTAIALSIAQSAHADLTSGLVAYYPFNGNANDASGNANNGTVYGATLTADRFSNQNTAFKFYGTGEKIVIQSTPEYNFGIDAFSINAWVQSTQQGIWKRIVTKRGATNSGNWYSLAIHNGKARFEMYANGNLDSTAIINDGQWHFITVVRDVYQHTFSIYVDGVLNTNTPDTGINLSTVTDTSLEIGIWWNEAYDSGTFSGSIDDIRLYNRALSAAEITELYNLQKPTAITFAATNITPTTATLNGQIDGKGNATAASFDFGPTTNYGQNLAATPDSATGAADISATITGLTCATRYHSRAKAVTSTATAYGANQSFTTQACLAPPSVNTNAATDFGANTATLKGQVNSNGATATVSFNYGLTTNYGNTIPAVPSTVYGNAAVTANLTGLNCNTSYHFRCQAVNSIGTGTGGDQIFATSATCPQPSAWFYPADKTVMVGKPFILDLKVNSGGSLLGAYDFSVGFDKTRLQVDTTKCTQGVCAGSNAVASNQIVTDNANGSIRLAGYDASGVGPGNDLQLLQVNFVAKSVPGATPVNLTLNDLADANAASIGNNVAKGSTVTITNWLCGDADGNGVVNIVDALAVSRYVVGLPPPPTVNLQAADVNGDGRVSIVDALLIARYSVGLLVTGSCLVQ